MARREKIAETREKSKSGVSRQAFIRSLTRPHAHAINIPLDKIPPTPTSTECAVLATVFKIGGAVPAAKVFKRIRLALRRETFGLGQPLSVEAFDKIVDRLADPSRDLIAVDAGRNLSLLTIGHWIAIGLPKQIGVDITGELAQKVADIAQLAPIAIRRRQRERQEAEDGQRVKANIAKMFLDEFNKQVAVLKSKAPPAASP